MAEPFLGQIMMFGGNFAPLGYALCNGALLSISQNDALFALLGTTYGGDGQTTFAVPDLRGRLPLHPGTLAGNTYDIGEVSGVETVTLIANQMPIHTHQASADSANGGQASPAGGFWGLATSNSYSSTAPAAAMNPQAVGIAGGNQPHENMAPFLVITFAIATQGIFPSRN